MEQVRISKAAGEEPEVQPSPTTAQPTRRRHNNSRFADRVIIQSETAPACTKQNCEAIAVLATHDVTLKAQHEAPIAEARCSNLIAQSIQCADLAQQPIDALIKARSQVANLTKEALLACGCAQARTSAGKQIRHAQRLHHHR